MDSKIFAKHLNDCIEITANDGCRLKELLHPDNDPVDLPCSFAVARLEPGKSTYRHYLKQTEVYFVLEGRGSLHVGTAVRTLNKGAIAVVPPQAEQWLQNTGQSTLEFIAIVSPPWREKDDIRL